MWRLTKEQEALRERTREFALERILPKVGRVEESGDYPWDLYEALADQGILALAVPEEYGGTAKETLSFNVCVEELARVSGTVSLMAAYVKLSALPILVAGTEEQKQRFLPGLASGRELACYAISEPHVGSDPGNLHTTAERSGDRWLLNGTKRFIGNAGMAEYAVVFARTGESGPEGISVFVVPGDADGFRTEPLETMGLSGWKLGELHFEDVEVPHENLLGAEDGTGFKAAMQCFDFSRPCVATQAVGVAQGAVDLALDYATRRQVFDQPLAAHQGVQMKLAAMEAEILAARALAYQASAMVDEGHPRTTKFSSAAKLVASEVAMRATTQAVDVLGGNGYLRGFPAERMMRDAKVLQIYEGANDIQRLVLAREMAGEAESREAVWPEWMPGAPGVASGEGPEAREHAPA